jgi:hypothetical protein
MAHGEIHVIQVGHHFDSRQALCDAGVRWMSQNEISECGDGPAAARVNHLPAPMTFTSNTNISSAPPTPANTPYMRRSE